MLGTVPVERLLLDTADSDELATLVPELAVSVVLGTTVSPDTLEDETLLSLKISEKETSSSYIMVSVTLNSQTQLKILINRQVNKITNFH